VVSQKAPAPTAAKIARGGEHSKRLGPRHVPSNRTGKEAPDLAFGGVGHWRT
jgi:hypothetical protein